MKANTREGGVLEYNIDREYYLGQVLVQCWYVYLKLKYSLDRCR